jgi:hypothetical protein
VRLPLHRGSYRGTTVWYVLTDASDQGVADELGLNYAPKLGNAAAGCPACVQEVQLRPKSGNVLGEATVEFAGIPDFRPKRTLTAGGTGFPPATAAPGAVGGRYSPFIRVAGATTVYNAPIVAVGNGPFDVVHHRNTADRVLAVRPAVPSTGPAQFHGASVDLLFIRGFDSGKPIVYLSFESDDPTTATLERATYVPALSRTPFPGGDDFLGSLRERIFPFVNGQTGRDNPQAQGLAHLILDGHAAEDASLRNRPLIDALRRGGDALNVQGDFPTLEQNNRRASYSPLWEAQFRRVDSQGRPIRTERPPDRRVPDPQAGEGAPGPADRSGRRTVREREGAHQLPCDRPSWTRSRRRTSSRLRPVRPSTSRARTTRAAESPHSDTYQCPLWIMSARPGALGHPIRTLPRERRGIGRRQATPPGPLGRRNPPSTVRPSTAAGLPATMFGDRNRRAREVAHGKTTG